MKTLFSVFTAIFPLVVLGGVIFFINTSNPPKTPEQTTDTTPLPELETTKAEPQLQWAKIAEEIPWHVRDSHGTAVFKDKIWVMGGLGGQPKQTEYWAMPHFSDVWSSTDGTTWELITETAPWGERRSLPIIVFQNKLWLMGGWDNKSWTYPEDVWNTEDGIIWNQVASKVPWQGREGPTISKY